jgi:putative toxin-antitoxin system antitoxin component (TIGR02293 family)
MHPFNFPFQPVLLALEVETMSLILTIGSPLVGSPLWHLALYSLPDVLGERMSKIASSTKTQSGGTLHHAKSGRVAKRESETNAFYRSVPAPSLASRASNADALGSFDRSGPNAYARLLGLEAQETGRLLRQVQDGLPFGAFETLGRALTLSSGELMEFAGIPARTLQRRRERGHFDPSEGDRLLRLARLFGLALGLFEGDAEGARRWIGAPQRALSGQTPLQMGRTELGAREVEQLIGRLEHGVFS